MIIVTVSNLKLYFLIIDKILIHIQGGVIAKIPLNCVFFGTPSIIKVEIGMLEFLGR